MVDPPPWPSRPGNAQDFDLFWLVRGLPPQPFPDEGYDYGSDERFGPAGTRWVFTLESLYDRKAVLGTSAATRAAIERALRKLAVKIPPAGSTSWTTPRPLAPPATAVEQEMDVMMRWVRTQLVSNIGTDEEAVHSLNWRHSTIENAPITNDELKAFGNVVRDRFASWFSANRGNYPATVSLRECRTSVLEQAAPGEKPAWPQPTQVAPFATDLVGNGQGVVLPYEVACGISLNTNFRGTSRFRGRVYLGPHTGEVMGAEGQFNPTVVRGLGRTFGLDFLGAVETATDYELHILSQKFGTSAKVTGIRVGATPDSQRRRRRDRPENYFQAWGTPVGGL